MCVNQKCLFCIPVEIGSLILGIFTSILNAVGILGCIGGLIYVNRFLTEIQQDSYDYSVGDYMSIRTSYPQSPAVKAVSVATNIGLAAGLLLFAIDFGFSVALADGSSKKKAGHVKAYFVYGVVKLVLAFIADMIVVCALGVALLPVLIILVIYGLLLVMVYQTYTKLSYDVPYGGMLVSPSIYNGNRVQLV